MRFLLVVAMLAASSATAWSQPKTDVVTLANGDRITGEVVSMERGRLEFKTDDAGTIGIEWDNVARLEATRQFDITLSDGRRFLGSLGPATARLLRIVSADGEESMAMPEVTSIWPIGASFWAKLDGSINAGFSYTRSSGIAQTTLNSDTAFRRPAFVARLSASATVTQQSDDTGPDDRASVELSYLRYRGLRWLVGAAGLFETNESLGLELRSQVGGAIGQRLVNTNRAQLEISGGVVVNEERGVDTAPTQNVEGLVVFRSSYFSYDGAKTGFDTKFQYYPSFTSWGRQRVQFDTSFSTELWKDLHFAVDFYDTFDSEPPSADAGRNDVGIVTSIGWSY